MDSDKKDICKYEFVVFNPFSKFRKSLFLHKRKGYFPSFTPLKKSCDEQIENSRFLNTLDFENPEKISTTIEMYESYFLISPKYILTMLNVNAYNIKLIKERQYLFRKRKLMKIFNASENLLQKLEDNIL